jgi:hypothetical protein
MKNPLDRGEFERESIVVLHDSRGRIVHIHHCVTEHGGKHPDKEALEKEALEVARRVPRRKKIDVAKLSLLHADPHLFKIDSHYKVNTKNRALVEIPKPTRKP